MTGRVLGKCYLLRMDFITLIGHEFFLFSQAAVMLIKLYLSHIVKVVMQPNFELSETILFITMVHHA